ncbi:MAG: GxxExxY protein [Candidatus Liptonbacteria bacterium]|nr:GxxExxY protein [Candidatus Liptonbacteria bacterium]
MNNANSKIVLPELSYSIIGAAFRVFNELGWGFSEKHYQGALAKELEDAGLLFRREVYIPFTYKSSTIGRYFADFIVNDKILLELKVVPKFGYVHLHQALGHLHSAKLKLGILIYFTREGIKYRRVVNPDV